MSTPDNAAWPARSDLRPLPITVVAVQSQVVYGRVGNNVALPALRGHGLEVAAVPTVVLSNTPHYITCHGGPIPTDWFKGYLDDLRARGALESVRVVLAGFMGGPEQAAVLAEWLRLIESEGTRALFIVDPVIGDHDHGVYVDPRMVEAYRTEILPLAHGITPNGFELERLTGMPVRTLEEVEAAARSLLSDRLKWITVTSAAPETWPEGQMRVLVVTADGAELIEHRRLDTTPKGTGDLFSAELVARWLNGASVVDAVRAACERVVAALEFTARAQCAELLLPGVQAS